VPHTIDIKDIKNKYVYHTLASSTEDMKKLEVMVKIGYDAISYKVTNPRGEAKFFVYLEQAVEAYNKTMR
jgi:hypothetical protein